MRWLRITTGATVTVVGIDALRPGPVVLLCRHASLADSLVSAWAITSLAHQRPRYVLKRELLADPCLDVVGHRVPNHFLDREAPDAAIELEALGRLAADMGAEDVAVIFPEGTRATAAKRERALARIAERDAARAERLAELRRLLPPRPAGSLALIEGNPTADVAIGWHTGFDGLDTFGGIIRSIARRHPEIHLELRRHARAELPTGAALARWIDDRWIEADREVDRMLIPR